MTKIKFYVYNIRWNVLYSQIYENYSDAQKAIDLELNESHQSDYLTIKDYLIIPKWGDS